MHTKCYFFPQVFQTQTTTAYFGISTYTGPLRLKISFSDGSDTNLGTLYLLEYYVDWTAQCTADIMLFQFEDKGLEMQISMKYKQSLISIRKDYTVRICGAFQVVTSNLQRCL